MQNDTENEIDRSPLGSGDGSLYQFWGFSKGREKVSGNRTTMIYKSVSLWKIKIISEISQLFIIVSQLRTKDNHDYLG